MNNPINLTVFDSRDLIEYKEELEQGLIDSYNDFIKETHNGEKEEAYCIDDLDMDLVRQYFQEDYEDYVNVRDFCEELEGYGDFQHGETIIHEDYFTEYCEELCEDIGHVSRDLPWYIANHIDWDGVASEIKQDYIEVEFEGSSYFMRA